MSSRYFAPAVNELTKITLRGKPLSKAYVGYVMNDADESFVDLVSDPRYDPSSDRWRIRFGYLVYELDPAEADSKGKTADALTDGNLGTSVSYTFTGDAWVDVGPTIDMGQVGDYLYLVAFDESFDPTLTRPKTFMRLLGYPPTDGEVLYAHPTTLTYWHADNLLGPFCFGVFVRGKQSFQLSLNPNQPDPTFSPTTLRVYEISIYRL